MLELLQEKPRHGYEIMTALEELSQGTYSPSPGVVYPSLSYLEEVGHATSEPDGNTKLYRISDAGSEFLEKNREAARETMERLARAPNRQDWHRMKAELWSLKGELKAAIWEKMDTSEEEKQRVFGVLRRALEEIRGK